MGYVPEIDVSRIRCYGSAEDAPVGALLQLATSDHDFTPYSAVRCEFPNAMSPTRGIVPITGPQVGQFLRSQSFNLPPAIDVSELASVGLAAGAPRPRHAKDPQIGDLVSARIRGETPFIALVVGHNGVLAGYLRLSGDRIGEMDNASGIVVLGRPTIIVRAPSFNQSTL